jgi:mRNA interferase MazF
MRRGEIWLVNLDPTIGAEMQKTRPAVIVSDDHIGILLLKVIVPLTDWKEQYGREGWMTRVQPNDQTGLRKASAADAFQVARSPRRDLYDVSEVYRLLSWMRLRTRSRLS